MYISISLTKTMLRLATFVFIPQFLLQFLACIVSLSVVSIARVLFGCSFFYSGLIYNKLSAHAREEKNLYAQCKRTVNVNNETNTSRQFGSSIPLYNNNSEKCISSASHSYFEFHLLLLLSRFILFVLSVVIITVLPHPNVIKYIVEQCLYQITMGLSI